MGSGYRGECARCQEDLPLIAGVICLVGTSLHVHLCAACVTDWDKRWLDSEAYVAHCREVAERGMLKAMTMHDGVSRADGEVELMRQQTIRLKETTGKPKAE